MPQRGGSGFHAAAPGTALTYIGGAGRFWANGRFSANGLVTSDRNEFIAWIPACAAPVPTSPESCVSAFPRFEGDRLKRFRNPSGKVPPLAVKVSMAFATAR